MIKAATFSVEFIARFMAVKNNNNKLNIVVRILLISSLFEFISSFASAWRAGGESLNMTSPDLISGRNQRWAKLTQVSSDAHGQVKSSHLDEVI